MPLVLDASVTLSWCFHDERTDYSMAVLQYLAQDIAIVPSIRLLEVTNSLLTSYRRGRLDADGVDEAFGILEDLQINVVPQTLRDSRGTVFELASEQNLSAYDAAYLDLALRQGLPLATLDDRLRAAAGNVGVAIHE